MAEKIIGLGGGALQPMSMCGNQHYNWIRWNQKFNNENNARKVAIFLHYIGEEGLNIFNSFKLDKDNVDMM